MYVEFLTKNYQYLALAAFLLVEWALPRTKKVEANSLLELVANVLCRVPLVSRVAVAMATPKPGFLGVDDIETRQVLTREKGRAAFELLLAMAVAVMLALALAGCLAGIPCKTLHTDIVVLNSTTFAAGSLAGTGGAVVMAGAGIPKEAAGGVGAGAAALGLVTGYVDNLYEKEYASRCAAPQPSPMPMAVQ